MITRTTTIGTMKNYRYNLNVSNNNMSYSMTKVMTERKFNSYAENPALATRCFQMRRSYLRTNSQLAVNQSTWHKYDVAWSSIDSITDDLYDITGDESPDASFKSILTSLNDPDASGRNALGQSLAAKAKGMVQTMNNRYGENYVFAGADHLNAPFVWGPKKSPNYVTDPDATNPDHEASFQYKIDPAKVATEADTAAGTIPAGMVPFGTLYTNDETMANLVPEKNPNYSKEFTENATVDDVDDPRYGEYLTADGKGTTNDVIANKVPEKTEKYDESSAFKYLKANGTGTNDEKEANSVLYFRGVEVDSMTAEDQRKMEYFDKEETRYLDLGLGFKEQDGEAISSTVFDAGLQGVYYLGGYGTEEYTTEIGPEGNTREVTATVPNNVISIVNRMSEILLRCDPDNGRWASTEDQEEFAVLASKFEDTISLVGQRYDELDTEASFLRDNNELLTSTANSLSEQITELEHENPAAAITEYMFARYAYDAALKVGNSILSQSLMDYMSF